ncbi:MAG: glycoside hydrolase superfamily [Monoraphidium minutum]|nr:MAG: glycoside hydrolase superfamily [Monoraphidium minutum]
MLRSGTVWRSFFEPVIQLQPDSVYRSIEDQLCTVRGQQVPDRSQPIAQSCIAASKTSLLRAIRGSGPRSRSVGSVHSPNLVVRRVSSASPSDDEGGKRYANPPRWLPQSACARWAVGAVGAAMVVCGALLLLLSSDWLFADMDARLVKALPDAPAACTADLRERIAWGAGTSAYQVEGAWDEGGRAPSIWDTWAHTPGKVQGGASGDESVDHYHRYEDDIKIMAALGIKHYRLSLSWPRLLPDGGRGTHASRAGVKFYSRLLRDLHAAGITPVVTLYNWDLPQTLQDMYGGFADAQFAEDFAYYADAAFRELGHLVRHWVTFNAPLAICQHGYGTGAIAPGVAGGLAGQFKCGHHLLLAHGRAVELYRGKYQKQQQGRISIALSGFWGRPLDEESEDDIAAAEAYVQTQVGWFADPIFTGDYPPALRRSTKALPKFTPEQAALVKGSVDFLGINFFTARYVRAPPRGAPKAQLFEEVAHDAEGGPVGTPSELPWLYSTPWAMRPMLAWVSKRYSRPEVWVTENGVAAPGEASRGLGEALKDTYRLEYLKGYMGGVCAAVAEDGVNLAAYFVRSLVDGFEWNEGYRPRFGIVHVDRLTRAMRRYPKLSAYWLSHHFFKRGPDEIACLEIKSCGGVKSSKRLPDVMAGVLHRDPPPT